MKKLMIWTLGALGLLIVVVLLALIFPPTGWIANQVEQIVKERTGYVLNIGELELDLLNATPSVVVSTLSLDGGQLPDLLSAERAEVALDLSAALAGELVVDRVLVRDADVQLVRTAKGKTSWTPGTVEAVSEEATELNDSEFVLPTIRELRIENASVVVNDQVSDTESEIDIQVSGSTLPDQTPLTIAADGTTNSAAVQANLKLESPLGDALSGKLARFAANVNTDGLSISLGGRAGSGPDALGNIDLNLDVDADSLASLETLLGQDLPPLSPATLVVTLKSDGDDIAATAQGTIGGESVEATLALDLELPIKEAMSSNGPAVIDLDARVGGVTFELGGRIGDPSTLGDVELAVAANVDSLAAFESLLGSELPELAPANLMATIRSEGDGYILRGEGAVDGEPVEVMFDLDSSIPDALDGNPVQLALDGMIGGAKVSASGSFEDIRTVEGAELDMDVYIDSFSALERLTGVDLPELDSAVLSTTLRADADGTVLVVDGTVDGEPAKARLELNTSIDQALAGDPVQIDLDAAVVGTTVTLDGRVGDIKTLSGVDLALDVGVDSLEAIETLLGSKLPDVEPASLSGTLQTDGSEYVVRRFDLSVADTTLEGDVRFDPTTGPPTIYANLISRRLDVDKLLTDLEIDSAQNVNSNAGADEDDGEGEGESAGPVLSSESLPLDLLFEQVQGAVELRVDKFAYAAVPVESIDMRIELAPEKAMLVLKEVKISGGKLGGTLELEPVDASGSLGAKLDLEFSRIQVARFVPDIELIDDLGGLLGGRVELWATGDSVALLAGSLDGGVLLLMGVGRLDAALVELAGIDLFQVIGDLLKPGEEEFGLRCAYVSLHADSGKVSLDDFVIDSVDTVFLAEGSFDLGKETLALRFEPHPKDPSLIAASTTVTAGGTFAKPQFGVDKGLPVRAAAAAALAIVATPAAALLPFIEIGDGEDSGYCTLEGALDGDAG